MTVNQVRHMNKVLTPQFLPSQKVTSVFVVLHLRDAGGQSQLRFSLFIDVIVRYFMFFMFSFEWPG